jgi:hypothetical protein
VRVLSVSQGIKSLAAYVAVAGLLFISTTAGCRKHDDHEKEPGKPAAEAAEAEEHEEPGGLYVTVEKDAQKKIGLEVASPEPMTLSPHILAYGVIEEDPARTTTVRAPVAGFIRAEGDRWPELGAKLEARAVIGAIEPRLAPMDQLALLNQEIEARSSLSEIQAELEAARISYESKKALGPGGVPERQVEEAEARVRSAEARLAAANRKLELLTAHGSGAPGLTAIPLEIGRSGEVVELSAGPGEAVESGQPILRIAQLDQVIARVQLPPGQAWSPAREAAQIWPVGDEQRTVDAHVIGPAPRAGPQAGGAAWLLSAKPNGSELRPGTPIAAHLPIAGEPLKGVIVPESAIVRFQGLAWVFVQESGESFERRMVELNAPAPQGWFVSKGLDADDEIVVTGAQILLSQQNAAVLEGEAEAAE